ncbi:cell surface A33 antigen-like [Chaetodon trifascialis]|uniref:cell surface A33 antigen-like n=1 Tax=Chaetodon trifascialis TaxID=109706 RepID=UPI003995DCE4
MMTKRQLGWQKLFLILTVLPCCRSLEVVIPQSEYEVALGGEISMTCSFTPAKPITNTLILSWEAFPETPGDTMQPVATFYLNNQADIAPPYEGRASLEVDVNNQMSTLHLTKVTIEDSRRYQCSVMIPGDDEGTTAASTSLLVLVPPSVPVCKIQGKAEYWQNISLTCMSEEGSPKPVTQWKSYSTQNIERAFPPKTTEKEGKLSLFNISREMSGFYVCTSTNRIGSASCNLTLAVVPASMNIGSTPIIIGVVVACVAVLGIIGFCCWWKRNKKNKNAEGYVYVVFDRDAPEAGEEYQDDKPDKDSETKRLKQQEEKDIVPEKNYSVGAAAYYDDDQYSHKSGKDRYAGSDIGSQRYQHDQQDRNYGSRDRLDDQRGRSNGSRDRLDDKRDHYSGSRDRLDDNRDRYGGSRDRLDDNRDRYGGSRDRLEDNRNRYGGSRDRLDDTRDRYDGSRDRLDDSRDRYGGSRDRLDDHSDRYRNLDHSDRCVGSRDRLDYIDDSQRNGYN